MIKHCRDPANRACVGVMRDSGDLRQMEWVELSKVDENVTAKRCPCYDGMLNARGDLVKHITTKANHMCIRYIENFDDPKLIKVYERATTTKCCPHCSHDIPLAQFNSRFTQHIKAKTACLEMAGKSDDEQILRIHAKLYI